MISRSWKSLLIAIFFLSLVVVGGAALFKARVTVAEVLLPWLQFPVGIIEQRFEVAQFDVIQPGSEYLFRLRLVSPNPITVYGRQLPGMDVEGRTLVTHALQHIMIIFTVFCFACWLTKPNIPLFAVLSFISMAVSLGLDLPITLLGSIEALLLDAFAPDQLNNHWLVRAQRFFTNGGRLALPLGLSFLSLALSQRKPQDNLRLTEKNDKASHCQADS